MKPKNFHSTISLETRLTPHDIYEALAVDAALLEIGDQLPELSDEEHDRVVRAAQRAASTIFELARVPTDWISFLAGLRSDRTAKLHGELHDRIFDMMEPKNSQMTADQVAALERISALIQPGNYECLYDAMCALESSYADEANLLIEQAFALGFDIAHDPGRLIFGPEVGA
jgi:hypothetical protein